MMFRDSNKPLLVIDAASFNAGIGIRRTDGTLFSRTFKGGIRAEALSTEVKGILGDAGLEPFELRSIAVNCGPGSFTGIRTGLAFAKGLAAGIPEVTVFPISALWAIRSALRIDGDGAVIVQSASDSFVRHMAPGPGVLIEDTLEADRLPAALSGVILELNRQLAIEKGIAPEFEKHPNVTTFESLVSVLLTEDALSRSSMMNARELDYLKSRF